MKEIELSIFAATSLYVDSSSGSDTDDQEEVEMNDALSMSDEDFESFNEKDFEESEDSENNKEEEEELGDDQEEEEEVDANEEEEPTVATEGGSEQAEAEEESETSQPTEEEMQAEMDKRQEAFDLLYGDPIKAAGREVKLRNPEHAKNFITMGVDYNQKMKSMKPHLAILKTLEKEGLLESNKMDRLNLLLEVEKGNKDALKRLISESDIDPLDLADEDVLTDSKNYQPQNHLISEREVEIEEALSSIENSPSQQRTLDIMTKEFDQKSREVISENPGYIVSLNNDIESGVYDTVMDAVNYKRDMKRVNPNLSDMELYIETVQELAEYEQRQAQQNNSPGQDVSLKQENQTKNNEKSRRKKIGMSGSKSSKSSKKREYDPMEILGMDDEKFLKEMGMDIQ